MKNHSDRMKYRSHKISLMAFAMVAVTGALNAGTILTPTGDTVNGTWAGWGLNQAPTSGTPGSFSTWQTGVHAAGSSSTNSGSFMFDSTRNPGYQIKPDWQGNFSVTTSKISGPTTTAASGSELLYQSYSYGGSNFQPGMNAIVGTQLSMTSSIFAGSSSGGGSGTLGYDFSSMPLGYLPAGTLLYIGDLDLGPGEGPMTVASNFNGEFLELIAQGNYSSAATVVLPQVIWEPTTGVYSIDDTSAVPGNNSSDFTVFLTTENLTTLSISSSINAASGSTFFRLAAPAETIPEPSAALLGTLGVIGLLRRRRHS